jgi:hypothetical protein
MASGNLSFRLVGVVLIGTGPGTHIQAVTRLGSAGARPAAGRYQILPPISHPFLGRVAIVVSLQEVINTISTRPMYAPNVLSGLTLGAGAASAGAFVGATAIGGTAIGPGAIRAGNAIGGTAIGGTAIGPGAAQAGAASFSPNQGFILTKDNVAAPNAVAVVSGFDELMGALENSGGAILEILG